MPEADPALDRGVADAPRGNWVDTYAPRAWRPYLRLSRADRPIGTWLLLIPCLWAISLAALADGYRGWDLWLAVSGAAGAFLMRGAGCTWNDLADRDFDARVERTRLRPLPSGQVTPFHAGLWMVAQALAAALILFTYNGLAISLGIASLALVAVYPFAKRFTWWPQVFLGLAFNWGALLAWAAHAGAVPLAALFLYAGGIAWTLFYDTIYALQDVEDDAMAGIRSTARLFGQDSRKWLAGFLVAAVTCLMIAVLLVLLSSGADALKLVVALGGVWAFGWHLFWQLRRLNPADPASCLAVFRSNRDAGLILWLFFAAASVV
ncbi:MAG: 4-hydroxybenzoate octaprenyltransferase [Pseudomonadota bacterium]